MIVGEQYEQAQSLLKEHQAALESLTRQLLHPESLDGTAVKQALGGSMKRILILTVDFVYGHHSSANAVSEALQETRNQECVVEIVNILGGKRVSAFLRKDQANYDRIIRKMPDLFVTVLATLLRASDCMMGNRLAG
jgi:hypothetical protein